MAYYAQILRPTPRWFSHKATIPLLNRGLKLDVHLVEDLETTPLHVLSTYLLDFDYFRVIIGLYIYIININIIL